MYSLDKQKFGSFVSERRRALGLTQRSLAERLSVSDKAVSKWERGQSMPDVALLVPLAGALGVSVTELLTGERMESDRSLEASEVEKIVKTAIGAAEELPRPSRHVRRKRAAYYLAGLAIGAAGELLLYLRHGAELWGMTVLFPLLGAIFGIYFCFVIRERLPRFYDENELGFVADSGFRMNIPGVYFNNRNWPHVLRAGRIWCLAAMALSPYAILLLSALFGEIAAVWIVFAAYLTSLFVSLIRAAKRHERAQDTP